MARGIALREDGLTSSAPPLKMSGFEFMIRQPAPAAGQGQRGNTRRCCHSPGEIGRALPPAGHSAERVGALVRGESPYDQFVKTAARLIGAALFAVRLLRVQEFAALLGAGLSPLDPTSEAMANDF